MISLKQGGTLLLLVLLSLPSRLGATQAPFDIDLQELDRDKPAPPPKVGKTRVKKVIPAAAPPRVGKPRRTAADAAGFLHYTVEPGDHIFKILMARFSMSNEAAERLIPEIIRINDISNIKNLTIGRTLLIPGNGRQWHTARPAQRLATAAGPEAPGAASPRTGIPGKQAAPPKPAPVTVAPAATNPRRSRDRGNHQDSPD
jgi:hypothetical protein